MDTSFEEINYPLTFREGDSKTLGSHLKLRHCVEFVGMKRVGISNFLRFFLYKKGVVQEFIDKKENHFFVTVDLNDLIEIEIFPFWILTFKRLVDHVSTSAVDEKVKGEITTLFTEAIQSQDIFLTVDALRKSVVLLCKNDIVPTLFLLRFDRIGAVVNKQFYANLVGLREATAGKLAYVFTSFRTLDRIAPEVFERKLMSEFSHEMYLQPANKEDFKTIFETLAGKYRLEDGEVAEVVTRLCGGHVQYLQLACIILSQRKEKIESKQIAEILEHDERIRYLGEEIWESLRETEQDVLTSVLRGKDYDREKAKYLWVTGILDEKNRVFSRLFENSVGRPSIGGNGAGNGDEKVEFTKKENALYTYLLENIREVCEREKIIEAVWSEVEDLGVSDWTIDRLVARLRTKLKRQGSKYQVVTVKTRGYKLTE